MKKRGQPKPSPYVPADPPKPWERQASEPEAAWNHFQAYRDLGPGKRSLAEAGRIRGAEKHTLEPMSRRWHWVERVQAWDAFVDQQRRDADIAAVRDMRTRHIQMAMSLQGAAALALNKIIVAERTGQQLTLKPSDVRELAELGTKLERLNRGEPEAINETRIAGPSGAPLEELRIRFVRPSDPKAKK